MTAINYLLGVYVPMNAVEKVKSALFAAGAGKFKHYDQCCWQTQGVGQFRPLEHSQPAIGQLNQLEYVEEIKLEMICAHQDLKSIIQALKDAHPYEEPAYHLIQLF
ncbi:MAG: NGG1p interacting factor NIF3 [Legionellales bacterium]|nr:NGG1p interacting factor NIF3 [Legionellales bacterium]